MVIPNGTLSLGSNTIYLYCQDAATNVGYATGTINKVPATPTMAGQTTSFADLDFDYDGLDGRDMTFTWNTANGVGFGSYFAAYRIYILPSSVTLDTSVHTPVTTVNTASVGTWTGDSTITRDSTNATLVSGASYIACIAILGSSATLGTAGCTSAATLTADTVAHPTILSARFTSNTNLQITTNATLDTTTTSHSGSLITYQIGSSTYTGTAIASVSSAVLNVTIPALGSTAATGATLIAQTGAIRANG